MMFKANHAVISVFLVLLAACSTTPAPVAEQGETLDRTPPPVLSSTGQTSRSGVIDNSSPAGQRAAAVQSSTGASTVAANTGAGRAANGSDSGPGTAATPGSAISVIAPAAPRGISRSGIERSTITASGTTGSAAAPAPAPAAASAAPVASAASGTTVHTVARGETLYSIAWQYGLDYRRLALANNLQPPYTIYPDQRLNVNQAGVSDSAVSALPTIPASPAGESTTDSGQRSQVAFENRRMVSVPSRQVAGVSWQWPITGRVLRAFGSTGGRGRGIDIETREGDPVYAAAAGDVVFAGRSIQGAGELLIVRHSASLLSAYMYNSSLLVSEGARVQAGDMIASAGRNDSGDPLLHFEVRLDGVPVDPIRYLPAR